mgnify:CR=1 FL=1|tara:strand:- start:11091 stop:11933 length:843 start_codon:yes stop_codon:yes gene_type:complete
MKFLVAGGNGLVGSKLIEELSKNNKVFATYRKKNNLKKLKNLKWINIKDLGERKLKVDVIINCIVVHPNSINKSYNDYINANVFSAVKLIDFFKKNDSKIFFNFSTISVYKKELIGLISESGEKNYENILSVTKLMFEEILFNSKINYINLRLPSVINFENNRFNWINKFYCDLKNNKTLKIINPQNIINELIDTKEIVRFINHVLKNKKTKKMETINFVPSNGMVLKKIVKKMKQKLQSKSKIKYKYTKIKKKMYCSRRIKEIFKFNITDMEKILIRNL